MKYLKFKAKLDLVNRIKYKCVFVKLIIDIKYESVCVFIGFCTYF